MPETTFFHLTLKKISHLSCMAHVYQKYMNFIWSETDKTVHRPMITWTGEMFCTGVRKALSSYHINQIRLQINEINRKFVPFMCWISVWADMCHISNRLLMHLSFSRDILQKEKKFCLAMNILYCIYNV